MLQLVQQLLDDQNKGVPLIVGPGVDGKKTVFTDGNITVTAYGGAGGDNNSGGGGGSFTPITTLVDGSSCNLTMVR